MLYLLYGYYNYNNFGDDLFEFIFTSYLNNKNINYIIHNPTDINIKYKDIEKVDCILLGGGEIINYYFLIPLFKYIIYHKLYYIPIIGASIGYNNTNNKYLDFFDKCIFRNRLDIIDNNNYYYDNDIVFSLLTFCNLNIPIINNNYIGYYLIDEINNDKYNIIVNFTLEIIKTYNIKFILFNNERDIYIVNNIINDCKLINTQYIIIYNNNWKNIINEILSNNKHLCLRYHSHVICYLYKLQFLSFPLTDKTKKFNKIFNIKYSYDINEMLLNINNENIIFQDIIFNFNNLDNIINISNYTAKNKTLSFWTIVSEIYNNYYNILKNKNNINYEYYINYITDQITFNILNNINSSFKYGIYDKLYFLEDNKDEYIIQRDFFNIISNIL